jgi:hypothetical protein
MSLHPVEIGNKAFLPGEMSGLWSGQGIGILEEQERIGITRFLKHDGLVKSPFCSLHEYFGRT